MNTPLKLLYVDDEEDIRTIVELALGMDPSMQVEIAASGAEALAKVGSGRYMPDLAMLDMMMPGMSGLELLQALRAREDTKDIPVIFVTASARSTDVTHYTDAGAIGVISKPFDPLTLADIVRAHHDAHVGGVG